MVTTGLFSDHYYNAVVARFGYEHLAQFRHSYPTLFGLDAHTLSDRYLCHDGLSQFVNTSPAERIVTSGIGMTGPPHLGTASQILKMVELQRGGERCQIVLGDLDALNGKGTSDETTRKLTEKYQEFIVNLGFDPSCGVVRTQSQYLPALETMYRLGAYVEGIDLENAEEDMHVYYAGHGVVSETVTVGMTMSFLLMTGDFVELGRNNEAVLVMLGIDEHGYVRLAQQLVNRLRRRDASVKPFHLAGLYSRLDKGFGGHPKFSKSLPGSAIDVTNSPAQIVQMIDEAERSPDFAIPSLMKQFPRYTATLLKDLEPHEQKRDRVWQAAVMDFKEYVIQLMHLWPA